MFAVQRLPEHAEGPFSAEERDIFAENAKRGDMGEDKEKDLTEEQRTPSESVGRTYKSLEEEQKSEKTY